MAVPELGLVVRYSFLWSTEEARGREEGVKERPSAVVMLLEGGLVGVLPITHAPPLDPFEAVELPLSTKRRLGLDDAESWIVVTELNIFSWPGPDLRVAPGGGPESVVYGRLPGRLLEEVRRRVAEILRARRLSTVSRTD